MLGLCERDRAIYPPSDSWRSQVLEARRSTAEAAAMFSRLAPVYELWAWWVERAPRRRVLELACVKDSETVLEVATGTGVQFVALGRQNRSGRTVGVDFAPGMALAEFHRVLKPGGRLVVTNMTRGVSGTTAYGTRSTHAASTSS